MFSWGNNIKRMYLDKGVTSKDARAYLDWINGEFKNACKAKIKELKK